MLDRRPAILAGLTAVAFAGGAMARPGAAREQRTRRSGDLNVFGRGIAAIAAVAARMAVSRQKATLGSGWIADLQASCRIRPLPTPVGSKRVRRSANREGAAE